MFYPANKQLDEKDVESVLKALETRGEIMLFSPRRSGKTTLVQNLTRKLVENGKSVVYIGADMFTNLQFLQRSTVDFIGTKTNNNFKCTGSAGEVTVTRDPITLRGKTIDYVFLDDSPDYPEYLHQMTNTKVLEIRSL